MKAECENCGGSGVELKFGPSTLHGTDAAVRSVPCPECNGGFVAVMCMGVCDTPAYVYPDDTGQHGPEDEGWVFAGEWFCPSCFDAHRHHLQAAP